MGHNFELKKVEFLLPLTLVLVKDNESGSYTSYFDELDNIIAEGETEEEATNNLKEVAYIVFKYWKENGHS